MSNHSVIEHRANYHFLKVEEDFLAICSKGKESPHCKALILAILEHWTNTKRDQEQSDYIYMSMPQWIASTYQLYERNVITECLRELMEEGMIERRPIIMYSQKTFDYRLCIDKVQELIRGLPAKETVLPELSAFQAYKDRQKEERAKAREKSPTHKQVSEKSHGVREKSPTASDKSRKVRDKSPKVREKSTQPILTKIATQIDSLSPSLDAQDDAVEVSHKIELTPEQKTRARSLKAKIEDRCGKLASGGANINENKAIARLVSGYSDADINDVLHYLLHCHFKWSKPDFKFKIRGNVILDEIEGVLRLFREDSSLRNAIGAQKTNSTPAPTSLSHRRLEVPPQLAMAGGAR